MLPANPRRYCFPVLFVAALAFAQTPAPAPQKPPLTFEVASIKVAGPLNPAAIREGKMHLGMKVDGAICDIGGFSLRDLIRTAYEVKDYQIAGADALGNPLDAQRYDIQATLPDGATEKDVPQMLQTLLAERFKLVIHRETRDLPVYALIVGKDGPKLKEADPEPPASAPSADAPAATKPNERVFDVGSNQVRVSGNMRDGKGVTVNAGPMGRMHISMEDGKMHLEAERMTMASLADTATTFAGRPVVDMTGLKGEYQVTLELALGDLTHAVQGAGIPIPGATVSLGSAAPGVLGASEPSGSSIFTSVQKLGLKLDARKAPIPFIVIDHYEKTPTEN
jgi:uncharacterized protein (TIGR03435 family)